MKQKIARLSGEREAIREFVQRVCARAEATIETTGKLEGAHYAAMRLELKALLEGNGASENEVQGIPYFGDDPDKRFLLFGYDDCYPGGARGDLLDSFSTLEEALQAAAGLKWDNVDLYDRVAGKELDLEKVEL